MTIGAAWDTSDPKKPFADFDVNADIKIPIGLATWLEELGTAYGSHTIIADMPLDCAAPGTFLGDEAGTIVVRMRVDPTAVAGTDYVLGQKYPFTVRVVGSDGTTQDDRTFRLKLVQR